MTLPLEMCAMAKSSLPSPLKSLVIMKYGLRPVATSMSGPNVPLPLPKSTETFDAVLLVTAISGLPSPLKSPTATRNGEAGIGGWTLNVPSPLPKRIETAWSTTFAAAHCDGLLHALEASKAYHDLLGALEAADIRHDTKLAYHLQAEEAKSASTRDDAITALRDHKRTHAKGAQR